MVDANTIRQALEKTYCAPEWYLGFEVGNSTGSHCRRYADAVAVNAYPSKGFEVRGFEIKVSKSDLKAELEEGIKSDEIARFCDYWFLVTPPGLTDEFTLPPTWGVIEYRDGKLKQKTRAKQLNKIPMTSGFLCAMLRGRERLLVNAVRLMSEKQRKQIEKETLWRASNAKKELEDLKDKLSEIKKATGISLDNWAPTKSIIHRLKAAESLEIIESNTYLLKLTSERLMKNAQEIEEAVSQILLKERKKVNAHP